MTTRTLWVLAAASLAAPTVLPAQQIAGEYQVEVQGVTYHLDRQPQQRRLRDNTVLVVEQRGDVIEIEFRSFASAMSTTTFHGRVGNDRFVALWSHPSSPGQALMITGEVDGRRLRGRLIYPRATSDAAVPGWTEVRFSAVPHERTGQAGPARGPGGLSPGGRLAGAGAAVRPSGGVSVSGEAPLSVDVVAMTEPEAPLAGHRIQFLARVTPHSPAESVARTELWIDGLVQGSGAGHLLEIEAGPFAEGRLDYEIVAVAGDGRRSAPTRHSVAVARAGRTTITGRLTGDHSKISDVQLVRTDGLAVARSAVDGRGRYRLPGIPAGRYVIFVNDGKTEARVTPTSNLAIQVDGRSDYERHFEVR